MHANANSRLQYKHPSTSIPLPLIPSVNPSFDHTLLPSIMRPPSASQELNGSSPARLKINKESHSIQKSSNYSNSTSSSSITDYNHEPPVVIYTHSPKIIHTEARDFMALVQKLTGMSREPSDRDPGVDHVAAAASTPLEPADASFEDSYNVNVDPQVSCSSISSNSLSSTDPLSPPDQTTATTMAVSVVAPQSELPEIPILKSTDIFLPEDPYLGYHEMSENSPSAANSWIHLTFAYGDQEGLF